MNVDALSTMVRAEVRAVETLMELDAIIRKVVRLDACELTVEAGPIVCITPKHLAPGLALRVGNNEIIEETKDVCVQLVLTMNYGTRICHVELYHYTADDRHEIGMSEDDCDPLVELGREAVMDALDLIGVDSRTSETLNKQIARTKSEVIACVFEKLRNDLTDRTVIERGI